MQKCFLLIFNTQSPKNSQQLKQLEFTKYQVLCFMQKLFLFIDF